jgi:hypothetical protein
VGGGGLPAPVAAAGGGPAGCRGADRAGAAEADGPCPGRGPYLRQIRPDRRAGGGAGGAARAGLPTARLDGPERELWLLADHREDLVAERTRAINRLRWHLHELDPGWDPRPRSLTGRKNLAAVAARLASLDGMVPRIAADLADRISPDQQAQALGAVAKALGRAGKHEQAATVARSIADPDRQAQVLAAVACALAARGDARQARRVASTACAIGRWTTVLRPVLSREPPAVRVLTDL